MGTLSMNKHTTIIHHTVTGHNVSTKTIKNWGYDLVIRWDGSVVKARGGAHTRGHNDKRGIALVGNFQVEKPNKKQLATLVKVLKAWRKTYKYAKIVGHRDLRNNPYPGYNWTACPGKNLYKLIPTIRREVMGSNCEKALAGCRGKLVTKNKEIIRLNKGWNGCKEKLKKKNKLIVDYQKEKKLNAKYIQQIERDMAKIVAENTRQGKRIKPLEDEIKRLTKENDTLKDVFNEYAGFWQYIKMAFKSIKKGKNDN